MISARSSHPGRSASSACCRDRSNAFGPSSRTPEKRGLWLASGPMELRVGGRVELRFRNAELATSGEPAPDRYRQFEAEVVKHGRVTSCDPPRLLSFTWPEAEGEDSEVTFELSPSGTRAPGADPPAPGPPGGDAKRRRWLAHPSRHPRRPSGVVAHRVPSGRRLRRSMQPMTSGSHETERKTR